jgi:hypothetical protein
MKKMNGNSGDSKLKYNNKLQDEWIEVKKKILIS